MQVVLEWEGSQGSHWRVLPGYKHRSAGDPLQCSDHVILKSEHLRSDVFLHLSRHSNDTMQGFSVHEVNASSEVSRFQIDLYAPTLEPDKLRAGCCLWLYHIEHGCFLDNGTTLTRTDRKVLSKVDGFDPVAPDYRVHLEKVHGAVEGDDGTHRMSSTGLWEVQLQDQQKGGVVYFDKTYRLRHLCSKRYLALEKQSGSEDWVAVLVETAGPQCDFRLHSAASKEPSVAISAAVRFEHVESGHWLHSKKTTDSKLRVNYSCVGLAESLMSDVFKVCASGL